MKSRRIFSVLLVFVITVLLASGTAAETINTNRKTDKELSDFIASLDGFDFDKLMELNKTIQLLLAKKAVITNPDGMLIPQGEGYIVGVDIPAGTYRVVLKIENGFGASHFYGDFPNDQDSFSYGLDSDGTLEVGKIKLPRGTTFGIYGSSLLFFPYTGLFH